MVEKKQERFEQFLLPVSLRFICDEFLVRPETRRRDFLCTS
jgi:hypothetical protein